MIAITEYLVWETRQLGFDGLIELIPNHRPRPNPDEHFGQPEGVDMPYVLFAGKLVEQKRPDRFLDVAEQLIDAGSVCGFVVCGAGPLEGSLKDRVSRSPSLAGAVLFTGHTTDVPRYLQFATCHALTSENESSPGITVEAMMSGCPVVAFEVDGVREILGAHGGVVVPQGDLSRYARELERQLASPATPSDRERISSEASRFATEGVVDRYLGVMGLSTGTERWA